MMKKERGMLSITGKAIVSAAVALLIYGVGKTTEEEANTTFGTSEHLKHFTNLHDCQVKGIDAEATEVECNGELLTSIVQLPRPQNSTAYISGGWTSLCPDKWHGCNAPAPRDMYSTKLGEVENVQLLDNVCSDIWSALFSSKMPVGTAEMFVNMSTYGAYAFDAYMQYCTESMPTRKLMPTSTVDTADTKVVEADKQCIARGHIFNMSTVSVADGFSNTRDIWYDETGLEHPLLGEVPLYVRPTVSSAWNIASNATPQKYYPPAPKEQFGNYTVCCDGGNIANNVLNGDYTFEEEWFVFTDISDRGKEAITEWEEYCAGSIGKGARRLPDIGIGQSCGSNRIFYSFRHKMVGNIHFSTDGHWHFRNVQDARTGSVPSYSLKTCSGTVSTWNRPYLSGGSPMNTDIWGLAVTCDIGWDPPKIRFNFHIDGELTITNAVWDAIVANTDCQHSSLPDGSVRVSGSPCFVGSTIKLTYVSWVTSDSSYKEASWCAENN